MGARDQQRGDLGGGDASTTVAREVAWDPALASAGTLSGVAGTYETPAGLSETGGPRLLPVGTRVGRYTLAEPLGAGGMGVVYRAYDPELERWLAIKILRSDRRGDAGGSGRFLREAQAMARLSHPNVVPIHDVGGCDGGLFLAMELVEGKTLRQWSEAGPRSWREVVGMFVQAGHGLAEAHAAGIVHRDFKPENVLVDRRGQARVTDFGLARPELTAETAPDGGAQVGSSRLTRTGMIVGTPAYMAPEQLAGRAVDARADVFAFCVALYEALHGHTPFGGLSFAERIEAIRSGELRVQGRRLPRWLIHALQHGLAFPCEVRPDMSALLSTLERGLGRRRSAWLALGAGVAVAVATPLMLREPAGTCDGAAEAFAGVWDPEAQAAVATALRASGRAYAEDTWSKVHVLLDRYVATWSALQRGSCEAHQRGEISSGLLDRRAVCLGERRADLAGLVEALGDADAETAEKAVGAVYSLDPVDRCQDPAAELRDPSQLEWAEQTRARIARARLLDVTGKHDEGMREIHALEAEAGSRGDEALRLEATLVRARLEYGRGEHERAHEAALAVFEGAHALGRDRQATQAASLLILIEGGPRARYEVGEVWAQVALAGAQRLGDDGREEATARQFYGAMLSSADRGEEALVQLRRAHELRMALLGADHLDTSLTAMTLGNALWKRGRKAEAVGYHQTAVRSRETTLGAEHPALIAPLANLGVSYEALGQLEDARRAWSRSLALIVANFARDHPNAAALHANLGSVESTLGDLAAARRHLEAAVRIAQAAYGDDHPDTALILSNLGDLLITQGDLDGGEAALREALQATARSVGTGHSNHAGIGLQLGRLLRTRGAPAEARAQVTAALQTFERSLGPDHPRIAEALVELAALDSEAGAMDEALARLQRARQIVEAGEVTPEAHGRVLLALARALDRDSAEVQALRAAILKLAEEAGRGGAALRVELAVWVAELDAPRP